MRLPLHNRKTLILLMCGACAPSCFSGKTTSAPFSGIWEEGLQSALGFVERNREKEENKLLVKRKVRRKM